eukprot:TRINITY_DN454_c0_g1_i2.p1 TRINITY_DN454_c0_g1~~TRINITY_DN454_c0_g1_i2.p1  ORF type:complete len:392 (-),score=29.30 TRINITY_DN454_c0_g1_i2:1769-2884(-)
MANLSVVVGSSSIIGRAIVKQLVLRGQRTRACDAFAEMNLHKMGVEFRSCTLSCIEELTAAFQLADTVFHCKRAEDPEATGALIREVNVEGTRNVITACRRAGVRLLIFTGSHDVVIGRAAICNGDESLPFAPALDEFVATMQQAEMLVREANTGGLSTCVLRCGMFLGDSTSGLMKLVIRSYDSRQLTHVVGSGMNVVDVTVVDNAAYAHVLASEQIGRSAPTGEVYFITNGEPCQLWELVRGILAMRGADVKKLFQQNIPYWLAYSTAWSVECVHRCAECFGLGELLRPYSTRNSIVAIAGTHYFSHAKATAHLGYRPLIPLQAAIIELCVHLGGLRPPMYGDGDSGDVDFLSCCCPCCPWNSDEGFTL